MTDIAKKLGFGFHEQQASREEEKQLLSVYYGVTDANFMNRLRVVVWQRDPNIIYEEDGIANPASIPNTTPTTPEHEYDAAQAKNNVVYLANRQEEQALTAQQQMEEDARRRARQEAA